ncbi:hypothetical protein BCEP4_2310006 [Burkholderia cepacia]|nr:hypothetical protein BCEP4_2310006 [Burkholderia cepacia]
MPSITLIRITIDVNRKSKIE